LAGDKIYLIFNALLNAGLDRNPYPFLLIHNGTQHHGMCEMLHQHELVLQISFLMAGKRYRDKLNVAWCAP
tara:strand:- start:571 stop:783 length:213 start_codon:yes stop_codon:yes gene_type:complete